MHIDLQTLSVVTVFIAALLGALLVFAGLQNHSVRAPMWWGAAHIVNASGFALLTSRGVAPDFVTIDLANALVLFGYGLTWTGARVFDGRPIRAVAHAAGAGGLAAGLPDTGVRRQRGRQDRFRLHHAGAAGAARGARSSGAAVASS